MYRNGRVCSHGDQITQDARPSWRRLLVRCMATATAVVLSASIAWVVRSGVQSKPPVLPKEPRIADGGVLGAAGSPAIPLKIDGRDAKHPVAVAVPIASLDSGALLQSPVAAPHAENDLAGAVLAGAAAGKNEFVKDEALVEPVRTVAPVSSARDEDGKLVNVPLASVSGSTRYRKVKKGVPKVLSAKADGAKAPEMTDKADDPGKSTENPK